MQTPDASIGVDSWIHLMRKKLMLTLPNPPIYIWFSLCETREQPLDIEMSQIKVRKSQICVVSSSC